MGFSRSLTCIGLVLIVIMSSILIISPNRVTADFTGDYEYQLINNGTAVMIKKYYGSESVLVTPGTIEGKPVVAIGEWAFAYCTQLTSVTIENDVSIIGPNAFSDCTSLTTLVLPTSLKSIEASAFFSCAALTSVTIPGNVTSIGETAFYLCTSLTSLTFSDGLTRIGQGAFYLCKSLTTVTIPGSVIQIGGSPFGHCLALNGINVSPTNPNYASIDGVLYNRTLTTLIQFPAGKAGTFIIPTNVTFIGHGAFAGCDSLASVTIPYSVTTIGNGAFEGCTLLASITIPSTVTSIGDYAFSLCSSLTTLTIPNNISFISYWAYSWCTSLTSVIIGTGVTGIGYDAFYSCTSLTSITFLGKAAPTSVGGDWIMQTPSNIRGHASPDSNFPAPGEDFNGLVMGWFLPGVPSAPTDLIAIPGNKQVTLSWNPPIEEGASAITNYVVYRSLSLNGSYSLVAAPDGTNYVDTGLINGQTYWYDVSATNPIGEGPKTPPVPATPNNLPPSLAAQSPSPNSTLSQAPMNIIVSLFPGIPALNITSVNMNLDSIPLTVIILNNSAIGACPGSIADGIHIVSAAMIAGGFTKTVEWSFKISSIILPDFTRHDSGKGYSILIPDGWTVQDNATVAGNHIDTFIEGPVSGGVQTNVIVLTGTDVTIKDTQAYLENQVQKTIDSLAENGLTVVMTGSPQYVTIANHTALVFEYDFSETNMHQKMAVIVDSEHMRFWVITCTESKDSRSQLDPTFNAMVNGFAITPLTSPTKTDIIVFLAIGALICVAVVVTVAFLLLRKSRGRKS